MFEMMALYLLLIDGAWRVPFPIINIVFGGQSHTERRPDSVPLYGIPYSGTSTLRLRRIAQHDYQGGVEVSNEKTIREYFWETALGAVSPRKMFTND